MKQHEDNPIGANRRKFLKNGGMTGLAGAAMIGGKLAISPQQADAAVAVGDLGIMNFALNLEYLEGEFYAVSTYGATASPK